MDKLVRILHWFRADLRLEDNTALQQAIQQATQLITLFIITPKTWQRHDAAPRKIQFILNNVRLSANQEIMFYLKTLQ